MSVRRRHLLGALLLAGALPSHAGLPEVVAAARPSVMTVGVYDPLTSPRFTFRGTGFVVGDGRLLATNAHVLPDEPVALSKLVMMFPGNRRAGVDAPAEIRGLTVLHLDRQHDVALLRFEGELLPPLALADAPAREGQAVAFIGFPIGSALGFAPVTHRGIVSSVVPFALPPPNAGQLDAAAIARLRRPPFVVYQLDATAYPGNSGGPLLDADTGQVLGILNMVMVKGSRDSLLSQPSGISYAIPAEHLRALIERR